MAQEIPHHIQKLLTQFLEGDTSLEQEDELAEFFRTHTVDEQWKPYQKMFAFFDSGMTSSPALEKSKPKRSLIWYAAAAAVVALVLGLAVTLRPTPSNDAMPQKPKIAETPRPYATVTEIDSGKAPVTPNYAAAPIVPQKSILAQDSRRGIKKTATAKPQPSRTKDSIEIMRTQAELEVAEQEILADRLLLEEELQQSQQRRRPANSHQTGWVTTSLNIQ